MPAPTLTPGEAFLIAARAADVASPVIDRENLRAVPEDPNDPALVNTHRFARHSLGNTDVYAEQTYKDLVARATRFELIVPPRPKSASEYKEWIASIVELARIAAFFSENPANEAAVEAGEHAGNLLLAASTVEFLLRLRVDVARTIETLEDRTRQASTALTASAEKLLVALRHESVSRPVAEVGERLAELLARIPESVPATKETKKAYYSWKIEVEKTLGKLFPAFALPPEAPVWVSPSPEELALRAHIARHPEDNDARKAYAGLAAMRNDLQSEVILRQFALLETYDPSGIDLPGHGVRVKQLLRFHPEWSEPLVRLGATKVRFFRGFPAQIEIDAAAFLRNAKELFAAAPIQHLVLRKAAEHLAALANSEHLLRLRSLTLRENALSDAHIAILAASPFVAELRALLLDDNYVTNAGVETIVTSPNFHSLVGLRLERNPCDDPVDSYESFDEFSVHWYWVPRPFGEALEAKYGKRPYFHPEQWPAHEEWPQRD